MTDNNKQIRNLPKLLTPQQIDSYVNDGFLIIEDLISHEELDELSQDIINVCQGKYENPINLSDQETIGHPKFEPMSTDLSDKEVMEQILCLHQPHIISPVIEKYVRHEKIAGILSQIIGAHLPFWDGSVKCMQSMFFVKPPEFQGQAWHQDEIYIPTRDRSLAGAWIAIDDASIENGCLWVLPGSHKNGYLYPQDSHNNKEEFDSALQSYGFDDANEIPVEVKKGSVVFFNGYLLHRSAKNRSNGYRRALVNHYMNSWSRLPWYKNGNESMATLDARCVTPVAGVDPYAWKGYDFSRMHIGHRSRKAKPTT